MTSTASILIVDDEAAQRAVMCLVLEQEGHAVTGCASADEAMALLARERFDLLFTDLSMPGIDGIELLRRALPRDPLMVGIVMTGAGTISTAVEAMSVGALDYILKPFRLAAITPVIARALAVRRLRVENLELRRTVELHVAEIERANRELVVANHGMAVANRSLEAANRALEVANSDLESFSYSVSHDLGAPVRLIGGFAKVLINHHGKDLPEESRELLGYIKGNATLMGELIDGLLRLSGVGRQPLERRPVDLDSLVRAVAGEQLAACQGRDIDLRIGELGGCVGDPALLRQVFANLLANACKYTRCVDRAEITVAAGHQDGGTVYTVADNGVGFDMAHAGALFGVFKRLHNDERFEGVGIGLSIAQRIVHRHGGRIWADAAPGRGARFSFTVEGGPA